MAETDDIGTRLAKARAIVEYGPGASSYGPALAFLQQHGAGAAFNDGQQSTPSTAPQSQTPQSPAAPFNTPAAPAAPAATRQPNVPYDEAMPSLAQRAARSLEGAGELAMEHVPPIVAGANDTSLGAGNALIGAAQAGAERGGIVPQGSSAEWQRNIDEHPVERLGAAVGTSLLAAIYGGAAPGAVSMALPTAARAATGLARGVGRTLGGLGGLAAKVVPQGVSNYVSAAQSAARPGLAQVGTRLAVGAGKGAAMGAAAHTTMRASDAGSQKLAGLEPGPLTRGEYSFPMMLGGGLGMLAPTVQTALDYAPAAFRDAYSRISSMGIKPKGTRPDFVRDDGSPLPTNVQRSLDARDAAGTGSGAQRLATNNARLDPEPYGPSSFEGERLGPTMRNAAGQAETAAGAEIVAGLHPDMRMRVEQRMNPKTGMPLEESLTQEQKLAPERLARPFVKGIDALKAEERLRAGGPEGVAALERENAANARQRPNDIATRVAAEGAGPVASAAIKDQAQALERIRWRIEYLARAQREGWEGVPAGENVPALEASLRAQLPKLERVPNQDTAPILKVVPRLSDAKGNPRTMDASDWERMRQIAGELVNQEAYDPGKGAAKGLVSAAVENRSAPLADIQAQNSADLERVHGGLSALGLPENAANLTPEASSAGGAAFRALKTIGTESDPNLVAQLKQYFTSTGDAAALRAITEMEQIGNMRAARPGETREVLGFNEGLLDRPGKPAQWEKAREMIGRLPESSDLVRQHAARVMGPENVQGMTQLAEAQKGAAALRKSPPFAPLSMGLPPPQFEKQMEGMLSNYAGVENAGSRELEALVAKLSPAQRAQAFERLSEMRQTSALDQARQHVDASANSAELARTTNAGVQARALLPLGAWKLAGLRESAKPRAAQLKGASVSGAGTSAPSLPKPPESPEHERARRQRR